MKITALIVLTCAMCTFAQTPKTTVSVSTDHLLNILDAMHKSHTYNALPSSERVLLVELLAAAEVDQITHLIDRVGFARIAQFLDHVTKIDQREAKLLEHYLIQELNQETVIAVNSTVHHSDDSVVIKLRDLQTQVNNLMQTHLYTTMNQQDKQLIVDLFVAAQHHNVTEFIHKIGYSKVLALVEHISSPRDTHQFLIYLVDHMEAEASGQKPGFG
ncbi:uncharacterized protein LOC134683532 [Mytilus trossulus]|uniref:uncharacterized protein LOC134683532 n=1 Tax=Mytilus trossulus TaxID=6551 RepID=UPI00300516CB